MGGYIFISYSRSDRAYVGRLAPYLEAHGVRCWYDHQIVAGDQFLQLIQKKIDACAAFVVVLTPEALGSPWVIRELAYALEVGRPVLPLLLSDVDHHILLVDRHREDVRGGAMPAESFAARLRELVAADPSEASGIRPSADGLPESAAVATPLILKIAGLLAKQLAAPTSCTLQSAVLGEPDGRALEQVCHVATRRAVAEAEEDGASEDELAHALSLLERLIRERPQGNIPSLTTVEAPDAQTLAQWRQNAQDIGLDLSAFPISFDTLVTRLLRLIPEELARAVGKPDNSLFVRVVLARLELLGANVAAMSTQGLSRLVPLSVGLRETLNHSYEACRAAGRAFVTPDLLLALAQTPQVSACLFTVRKGLDKLLTEQLRRYLATTDTGPFHAFDWGERADVRRAQQLAWAAQVPAVTDLFMLRGVLDTPTNTRRQLAVWLGTAFDSLRDLAQTRSRAAIAPAGTPGVIFGP
jgi:TIR domain